MYPRFSMSNYLQHDIPIEVKAELEKLPPALFQSDDVLFEMFQSPELIDKFPKLKAYVNEVFSNVDDIMAVASIEYVTAGEATMNMNADYTKMKKADMAKMIEQARENNNQMASSIQKLNIANKLLHEQAKTKADAAKKLESVEEQLAVLSRQNVELNDKLYSAQKEVLDAKDEVASIQVKLESANKEVSILQQKLKDAEQNKQKAETETLQALKRLNTHTSGSTPEEIALQKLVGSMSEAFYGVRDLNVLRQRVPLIDCLVALSTEAGGLRGMTTKRIQNNIKEGNDKANNIIKEVLKAYESAINKI